MPRTSGEYTFRVCPVAKRYDEAPEWSSKAGNLAVKELTAPTPQPQTNVHAMALRKAGAEPSPLSSTEP